MAVKRPNISCRPRLSRFSALWLTVLSLLVTGCAGMGSGTIGRDRMDYDHAVTESWQRQLLMNLVKLRYGDTPFFLDVSSITNSYGLETQVNLTANWWGNIVGMGAENSQSLGAYGRYSDKPTITYNPLLGQRFTRSLMTPVPPGVVLSLMQAGWTADVILRAMVTSVNGVQNRFGSGGRARGADPDFYRFASALRRIQASGAVGMRIERVKDQEWAVMTLAGEKMTESLRQDQHTVREILGLKPDTGEFRVVFGSAPTRDGEVAMVTRSMLEMLIDTAASIDVPAAHVAEGRVPATRVFESDAAVDFRPLLRISSGPKRPDNTFVAIPYRGHWFWVDDLDYPSKIGFSFLLILSSLNDVDSGKGAPIITIPAN
ncbi:MAG: hypothetical protein V2B19_22355 [Pseudomonadota bacterium]